MSKVALVKIARLYKPFDIKFRNNKIYLKISEFLRSQIYIRFLKTYVILPHVESYYNQYKLTKVDDNLAFFDSFWGRKIGCNPYAIFLEMYSRPELINLTFYWTKAKETEVPSWMLNNDRIVFVANHSAEFINALLKAKYLFANSNLPHYFVRKPEQLFINTWHGIPLKHMGKDMPHSLSNLVTTQRNFSQSTHIVMASQYAVEKTVLPYGGVGSHHRVCITGSPRVDITLKSVSADVKRALKVPAGKKLILFAPTWRGTVKNVSIELDDQIKVIEMLESKFGDEYQVLLSLHDYTKSKLSKLPGNCNFVPEKMNINELLAGVDILISDYSSIFFDFLALDRTVILHVSDLKQYKSERGLYLDLEKIPVMITETTSQLEDAIKFPKIPSTIKGYKDFMDMVMPFENGKASERIVDILSSDKIEVPTIMNPSKQSILFYAGGLMQNGITHALLNLVSSFDENRFDVFLVVEAYPVDEFPERRELFEKIPKHCKVILKANATSIAKKDANQMKLWREGSEVSEMNTIDAAMFHEVSRVIGDRVFDYAVDYSGYSSYWAKFILMTAAKKRIIYQHNDLFSEVNNPLKSMKTLLNVFASYKDFDKVVAVSPTLREINFEHLAKYYIEDSKAVAARNVIIPAQIREKANQCIPFLDDLSQLSHVKAANENDNVVKFITVSRLSSEKNQILLIRAMEKVISSGVNAFLYVVGDGNEMESLLKECKKLGISKFVHFTRAIPNPFPLVKLADCFVLPSNYEGQPMVLLEALTLGKYCIGSDIPSIKFVLQGNGITVNRTPEDFANAMIDFAVNKNELTKSVSFNAEAYQNMVMDEFYAMLES